MNRILSLAGFLGLLGANPARAYIDGGGARITLPEVLLEFHTASVMTLERSDIARGGFLFKVGKHLKGNLEAKEVRLQISWEGAPPPALKEAKPGHQAVFFTMCFDKRSLVYLDGVWAWTNPSKDGWESGGVRPDFEHVFVGKSQELSDAVAKLLLGHEVVARCQRRENPAEMQWVRYSMKTPHDKALARDPGAPPAQSRPLAAWISELADPKPAVRIQGALALAEFGSAAESAAPELVKALKDKDSEVRYASVHALGVIVPSGKTVVDGLAHALSDEDWFVRYTAALSLQRFGPKAKGAEPALVRALTPSDPVKDFRPIRCGAAMVALAKIDPHAKELGEAVMMVVGKLLDYEADDSDGSRVIGAQMLGECGPLALPAVPALLKRLKDRQEDVRIASAEALLRISPEKNREPAMGTLLAELKNHGLLIRTEAIEALGRLGPEAKEAVPALEALLKDSEPEIHQAVTLSLKKIATK